MLLLQRISVMLSLYLSTGAIRRPLNHFKHHWASRKAAHETLRSTPRFPCTKSSGSWSHTVQKFHVPVSLHEKLLEILEMFWNLWKSLEMSLALCNLRCGAKERVQITDTLAWWFGSLVWLGSNSGHIVLLMEIHCLTEVFAHEVDMLRYF
jgi:hypothetical protein